MLSRIIHRSDRGGATPILMMAMAVVLAAGVLLFGRIAQAGDMRTRAQVGADAAALGTLGPLRDAAVDMAAQGMDPDGAGSWMVDSPPETAADRYAAKNKVVRVGKVRLSGEAGTTARVDVATRDCQLKSKEELTEKEKNDLRNRRNLCTDNAGKQGIGRTGRATAVAKMISPICRLEPIATEVKPEPEDEQTPEEGSPSEFSTRLTCDGVVVWEAGRLRVSRDRIAKLFKIRLVNEEDPVQYTGAPDAGLPVGTVVDAKCDEAKKPDSKLPFGEKVVAYAKCWLGTPYTWGGGNARGPSRGICCSPGGHDGRIRVGFDCSGLTLYAVYHASGGRISLGHFTGNQFADRRGTPIRNLKDLRPGDLMFFGSDLHHVGIYAGGNQMVHAPQTGDVVKISGFSRNFAGGVRFG